MQWQNFIEGIKVISNPSFTKGRQERLEITEETLPKKLVGFLNSFYGSYEEEPEGLEEGKENGDETPQTETTEDLQEAVDTLKEEIETLKKELTKACYEKKKELTKKLRAFQKNLALKEYFLGLKTIGGRLNILLNNKKDLEAFHKFWLQSNSTKELSYPIFMATSQKSGKDNSGEYVCKKDVNGELMLDEHGHLIVGHDLDFIAEKFIEFVKKHRLDFWKEGYTYKTDMPSELPMAAEAKEKYGKR